MVYPPQIRAAGAKTVYWDMYLNKRVGQPTTPAVPDDVVAKANKLFDYAATSSNCATPIIAENELFGAGLVTPWSDSNAQYRANVLLYLRTIASRGGRPVLLVNSPPYTVGDAGEWWRQVAQVADIVREVYFNAPRIYKQGPVLGSRTLRLAFRQAVLDFSILGIPPSRLGIMLGFQTERGQGGREGLAPAGAWYETVKWQVLAARQVALETKIASIWSWGWANWGQRGYDPDKAGAACVYLWTRAPGLCDGPGVAGDGFDASRTAGQIILPGGVQCVFAGSTGRLSGPTTNELARMTGDREVAYTALLARLATTPYTRVSTKQVLAAERAVISSRFKGSRSAYAAALRTAHASVGVARGVIADELRRWEVEASLAVRSPSGSSVSSFYLSYPDLLARPVTVKPSAWWLGGRTHGLAISAIAPASVFDLPTGKRSRIATMQRGYTVWATGGTLPLGAIPLDRARPAIESALGLFARGAAFESWSSSRQESLLSTAICRGDDLPAAGSVDLTTYLPFLRAIG